MRKLIHGHRLSFSQLSPIALSGFLGFCFEIRKLHPVEWEVPLAPFISPVLNHQWEQIAVLISSPRIGFPLIPNRAANAVSKVAL